MASPIAGQVMAYMIRGISGASSVSAGFGPAQPPSFFYGGPCPAGGTAAGSCCVIPAYDFDAGIVENLSAGTITVTDTSRDAEAATLSFESPTDYQVAQGFMWSGGDTVSFSAAGATVPAFSGSLVGTTAPTLLSPTLGVNGFFISASTDLTVTWTPAGPSGATFFVVLTPVAAAPGMMVGCVSDDSAGTLTVPASLLAQGLPGDLEFGRTVATDVQAGSYRVQLALTSATVSTARMQP